MMKMSNNFFNTEDFKPSPCPSNFVPKDAKPIISFDTAHGTDRSAAVKGFVDKDGCLHIQEIVCGS